MGSLYLRQGTQAIRKREGRDRLKRMTEHFGRNPVLMSRGIRTEEESVMEDEVLLNRVRNLNAELSRDGKKRMLKELALTPCLFGRGSLSTQPGFVDYWPAV